MCDVTDEGGRDRKPPYRQVISAWLAIFLVVRCYGMLFPWSWQDVWPLQEKGDAATAGEGGGSSSAVGNGSLQWEQAPNQCICWH